MWGCRWRPAGPEPQVCVLIVQHRGRGQLDLTRPCTATPGRGSDPRHGGCRFARARVNADAILGHLRQHQSRSADIGCTRSMRGWTQARSRPERSAESRRRSSSDTRRSRHCRHARFRHVLLHQRILCRCQHKRPCGHAFQQRNARHCARRPGRHFVRAQSTVRPSRACAIQSRTQLASQYGSMGPQRRVQAGPIGHRGEADHNRGQSRPGTGFQQMIARSCGASDAMEPSCLSPKI